MSYPVPKIIYNPGTGNVTLTFSFPPINKPGAMERSTDGGSAGGGGNPSRIDSVTLSGIVQSCWFRTDWFKTIEVSYVPHVDSGNWKVFMDYAMTGGQFDYYPDATLAVFQTMILEDTDWNPEFSFKAPDATYGGFDKFTMKMRWISGSGS